MSLSKVNTQFKNYETYIFNNPATEFTSIRTDIFNGTLDENGNTGFMLKLPTSENAPGMLRANITTQVFEPAEMPVSRLCQFPTLLSRHTWVSI